MRKRFPPSSPPPRALYSRRAMTTHCSYNKEVRKIGSF